MLDVQFVFVLMFTAATTIGVVVYSGLQSPRRWCPSCGAVLPQFRIPRSLGEGWRREWTCHRCDERINMNGRAIDETQTKPLRVS